MKRIGLLIVAVGVLTGLILAGCGQEESASGGPAKRPFSVKEVSPAQREAQPKKVEPVSTVPRIPLVPTGEAFVVADFNSGAKPSNIGGGFGAWDKDPADFTQTCKDSFDSQVKYGNSGFSLKLDYDVDSPNPAYNGFWMKLENLDASGYSQIAFMVKGDGTTGYTEVFKIELKSANGEVGRYYASGVDSSWKLISIPLRALQGLSDYSALTEFVIVFEDSMATNKAGIIHIDDIQFIK